jgi:hypothetical protein
LLPVGIAVDVSDMQHYLSGVKNKISSALNVTFRNTFSLDLKQKHVPMACDTNYI